MAEKQSPPPSPAASSKANTNSSDGPTEGSRSGTSGANSEERTSTIINADPVLVMPARGRSPCKKDKHREHRLMLRGLSVCPYCRGCFRGKEGLERHLGSHAPCRQQSLDDTAVHRCERPGCGEELGAVAMVAHKMTGHFTPSGAAECPYCGWAFFCFEELSRHIQRSLECSQVRTLDDEQYPCEFCEDMCVGAYNVLVHKRECSKRPPDTVVPLVATDRLEGFCDFPAEFLWCAHCDGRFRCHTDLMSHFDLSNECFHAMETDPVRIKCEQCGHSYGKTAFWYHLDWMTFCNMHYSYPSSPEHVPALKATPRHEGKGYSDPPPHRDIIHSHPMSASHASQEAPQTLLLPDFQ